MTKYTVLRSPHPEDYEGNPPPWVYEEEAFCSWVWEVFLEGYKRDVRFPEPDEAMELLLEAGYVVECS